MTTTQETRKQQRAELQTARNAGLKRRHAERLRRKGWVSFDAWLADYEAARDRELAHLTLKEN